MALLQTQTSSKTSSAGTTSTASLSTTTTGSLVVVTATTDSGVSSVSSITCAGMTFVKWDDSLAAGGTYGISFWYALNITGNTTPTLTVNYIAGAIGGAIIREYSGGYTVLDQHKIGTTTTTSMSSGATSTLTGTNDLVIGYGGTGDSGNTYTAGAGFANAVTLKIGTTVDMGFEDKTLSGSNAAQTATFTITNVSNGACGVATFQASASGGRVIGNINPGQTWARRFAKYGRNQSPVWSNQGQADIPDQMKVSAFRPGQTWINRFAKAERHPYYNAAIPFAGTAWTQNLADSVTSSDTIAFVVTKNLTDSVTSSDSLLKAITKNFADSITSSDSLVKSSVKNTADSVTISDSVVKSPVKILSDSVTTSDALVRSPIKNITDSVTSSDSITSKAVVKKLTDAVTPAETITITEGNFVDIITTNQAFTLHVNDSVTSSDSNTRTSTFSRSLADSATITDAISNKPTKNLSDTITTSDSSLRSISKALSDTVTSSDSTSKAVVSNRSDSVVISDVIIKSPAKILADSVTPSDIISKLPTKKLSDSVTTSDAIVRSTVLNKSDTVIVSDAFNTTSVYVKTLGDTVVVSDGITINFSGQAAAFLIRTMMGIGQ